MSFNQEQGRAEYTASVAQTVFPFSFKIFANTDLKVYKTALGQTADDATDIILLTTDYTVVVNGDLGGTMTLNSGATIGDSITIVRDLSINRPVEYQTNGDLLATTLNEDQEYQTYLTADQQDKNALYVTLQESSQGVSNTLPSPDALKVVGWNSQADALENFTVGDDDVFINILNVDAISDLDTVNILLYSTVNVKGSTLPNDGGGGIFNYDVSQSAVNDGINIINGWARENRLVNTVDNMSELLTISTVTNQVNVKGYYTQNDGGGGVFNYDASIDKSTANSGTIIDPSVSLTNQGAGVGLGCWVRQFSGTVNVQWFGLKPSLFDDQLLITSLFLLGDSLTAGAGGTPYPITLSSISAFNVTNQGVGGETSTQIKDRFLADPATQDLSVIMWVGRNNADSPQTTLDDVDTMVADLRHSRFLILSVLNGSGEGTGTSRLDNILTANQGLKIAYPENYFDIRSYLISDGLSDAEITPTAQDLLDIADNIIPDSLRSDAIHLNTDGYNIVAEQVRIHIANVLSKQNTRRAMKDIMDSLAGYSQMSIGGAFQIPDISTNEMRITRFGSPVDSYGVLKLSGDLTNIVFDKAITPQSQYAVDLGRAGVEWLTVHAHTFKGINFEATQFNTKLAKKIIMDNGTEIRSDVGNPEGVVTAPPGSMYLSTNAGAGSTLFIKESGSGNTGWIAK